MSTWGLDICPESVASEPASCSHVSVLQVVTACSSRQQRVYTRMELHIDDSYQLECTIVDDTRAHTSSIRCSSAPSVTRLDRMPSRSRCERDCRPARKNSCGCMFASCMLIVSTGQLTWCAFQLGDQAMNLCLSAGCLRWSVSMVRVFTPFSCESRPSKVNHVTDMMSKSRRRSPGRLESSKPACE